MIKLFITGDFCPRERVKNLVEDGKFSEVF